MTLSVCMIAKDEQDWLIGAIESVRRIAEEIVIGVDSASTDNAQLIAESWADIAFQFDWHDSFAEARNETLKRASGSWILVIDPDERLLEPVAITNLMDNGQLDAYAFLTKQCRLDGTIMKVTPSSTRLWRNDGTFQYHGRVHEEVWRNGERLSTVGIPSNIILSHIGHDPDVFTRRGKSARNLHLAQLMAEDGDPIGWYHMARQYRYDGDMVRSIECAKRALESDGLPTEIVEQLQQLKSAV